MTTQSWFIRTTELLFSNYSIRMFFFYYFFFEEIAEAFRVRKYTGIWCPLAGRIVECGGNILSTRVVGTEPCI